MFIVVLVSLILVRGIKESAVVNSIVVGLKLTIILIFIVVGWFFINPANHHPFIPGQYRAVRRIRLERRAAGRGIDFLRVHRV